MHSKIFWMALLCSSAMATAAAAQEGSYFSLELGANHQHESDLDYNAGTDEDANFTLGWQAGAAVGYRFGSGFRTELEYAYRLNAIDDISGNTDENGDVDTHAFMVNALYDFNTGGAFSPYVGAGLGWVHLRYDDVGPVIAGATTINDTDDVLGAQGIAGVSYRYSDLTEFFADYRYLHSINPEMTTASGVSADVGNANSTIMIGMRINFGASSPAPAAYEPPPAPAPAPKAEAPAETSRTYLVFFNWDKYDLTPEAKAILKQAADDSQAGRAVEIKIVGHADRSGSDAYNVGLSQKRADAVAAELAQHGINAQKMNTEARGERDPLVPTDDGVREPQNRRTEIRYVKP